RDWALAHGAEQRALLRRQHLGLADLDAVDGELDGAAQRFLAAEVEPERGVNWMIMPASRPIAMTHRTIVRVLLLIFIGCGPPWMPSGPYHGRALLGARPAV